MNEALLAGINNNVGQEDTLYFLGDWSFGNPYNIYGFRKRIICQNIIFILGNHDRNIIRNKPITLQDGTTIFPQDLFTEIVDTKVIHINKQMIIMNHYAKRVWEDSHLGSINLYGHSHGTLPPHGKQMDVGVDNIFKLLGEYRPISYEEVLNEVNKRDVNFVDHHNSNTD